MDLSETLAINIRGKELDRLFSNSPTEFVLGVSATSLGVVACLGLVPLNTLLVWAACGIALYALRLVLGRLYRKLNPPNAALGTWLGIYDVSAMATGLAWGLFGAYLLHDVSLVAATPVLLLACAAALAAVALHAGSVRATVGCAAAALLPPAAIFAMQLDNAGFAAAAAAVLVVVAAAAGGRQLQRLFWESAVMQRETEHLTGHLDQRRIQVEKLNVALKTTQAKHEQAEVTLRRTAADLGLAQGKAKALADTLERISPLCQVTGLSNRRHFDQQIDNEWRRAGREGTPVTMIVVDMDEYQEYVEAYGRQSADTLLKRVAQTVKGFGRRPGDAAGRYDESKITLLLPGCDARNGARIADALRKRVEALKIPHAKATNREVMTVHIGVATMKPSRHLPPGELLKRMDAALYEAQFQGGNRVVAYQPLSKLKLEHWDMVNDGPLTEQSLIQKLLVWGYDTSKETLKPGTPPVAEMTEHEKVIALLTGEVKIEVEGHAMMVKTGDCVVIPAGVEIALHVVGERAVHKFTAVKNK
ncbi:MAG: diguanylate cyclase [Gammaproteobacteria bacterium]|nr:diguanylate cyclase [Gammaproteobacteria bacterium]MBI5616126.1 diguanylate cyclase [Gammaproteobacteria bacterium]